MDQSDREHWGERGNRVNTDRARMPNGVAQLKRSPTSSSCHPNQQAHAIKSPQVMSSIHAKPASSSPKASNPPDKIAAVISQHQVRSERLGLRGTYEKNGHSQRNEPHPPILLRTQTLPAPSPRKANNPSDRTAAIAIHQPARSEKQELQNRDSNRAYVQREGPPPTASPTYTTPTPPSREPANLTNNIIPAAAGQKARKVTLLNPNFQKNGCGMQPGVSSHRPSRRSPNPSPREHPSLRQPRMPGQRGLLPLNLPRRISLEDDVERRRMNWSMEVNLSRSSSMDEGIYKDNYDDDDGVRGFTVPPHLYSWHWPCHECIRLAEIFGSGGGAHALSCLQKRRVERWLRDVAR